MDALATIADLDRYGIDYSDNESIAQNLLASVSAAVRAAAGCPISIADTTITIPSTDSRRLQLPVKAVRKVYSVKIDGEEITDWKFLGGALYRECPWNYPKNLPHSVTINLAAGWDPVPEDIVRLVCSMVAAGINQQKDGGPGAHRAEAYARIDDVQIGYRQGGSEVIDAVELPDSTRNVLRQRFGGPGAISIGVFR